MPQSRFLWSETSFWRFRKSYARYDLNAPEGAHNLKRVLSDCGLCQHITPALGHPTCDRHPANDPAAAHSLGLNDGPFYPSCCPIPCDFLVIQRFYVSLQFSIPKFKGKPFHGTCG